jgi:hypothetical protein
MKSNYRLIPSLVLSSIALAASLAVASAQTTIYSDTLLGTSGPNSTYSGGQNSDPLNGSIPDTYDAGGNGGAANAAWIAQSDWGRTPAGTGAYWILPNTNDNAYLPFTPVVGQSYLLTATLDAHSPSASGFNNTELGFTNSDPLNASFYAAGAEATIQMYCTSPTAGTLEVSTNGNWGVDAPAASPTTSSWDNLTVSMTLAANGSDWNMSVAGVDASSGASLFSAGPYAITGNINYVGFDSMQNTSLVTNLSLVDTSASVPEPATWATMLSGFGMFFALRKFRSRKA